MTLINPKPLEPSQTVDLYEGLYNILSGIKNEFGLNESELAKILHKPKATVNGWFKNKAVIVSKTKRTPDDVQIYELIELYDALTSYFVSTCDQTKWLKTEQKIFKNMSPLEFIYTHPSNLRSVREYLETRMNP